MNVPRTSQIRLLAACLLTVMLPLSVLMGVPQAIGAPSVDSVSLTMEPIVNLGGKSDEIAFLPLVKHTIAVTGTDLGGQTIQLKLDDHLTENSATYPSAVVSSSFDVETNIWEFVIADGFSGTFDFDAFGVVTREGWRTLYPGIGLESSVALGEEDDVAVSIVQGQVGDSAQAAVKPTSWDLRTTTDEGSGNRTVRLALETQSYPRSFLLWEPTVSFKVPVGASIDGKSAGLGTWDGCTVVADAQVCTFTADSGVAFGGVTFEKQTLAWVDVSFLDTTKFPDGSAGYVLMEWRGKTYDKIGTNEFADVGLSRSSRNLVFSKYEPADLFVSVTPSGGAPGEEQNPDWYRNSAIMTARSTLQAPGGATKMVVEAPFSGNEAYWGNSNVNFLSFRDLLTDLPPATTFTLEYLTSANPTSWKTYAGPSLTKESLTPYPWGVHFVVQPDAAAGQFMPPYIANNRVSLPKGSTLVGVRVTATLPGGGMLPYQSKLAFTLAGDAKYVAGATNRYPLTVKATAVVAGKTISGQGMAYEKTSLQNLIRVNSVMSTTDTTLVVAKEGQFLDFSVFNRDSVNSVDGVVVSVVLPKGVHYAGTPSPEPTAIKGGRNYLGQIYPTVDNGGLMKAGEGITPGGLEYVSFRFTKPLEPGAPIGQIVSPLPAQVPQFSYIFPVTVGVDALTQSGLTAEGSIWSYVNKVGYPQPAESCSIVPLDVCFPISLKNKYGFGLDGAGVLLPAVERNTKVAAPGELLIDKEVKTVSDTGFGKSGFIADGKGNATWRVTTANFLASSVTKLVLQDTIPVADIGMTLTSDVSIAATSGVKYRVLYSSSTSANPSCVANSQWHSGRLSSDTKFCISVDALAKGEQVVATYDTKVKQGVDLAGMQTGTASVNTAYASFTNSDKIINTDTSAKVILDPNLGMPDTDPAMTVTKVWESGGGAKKTSGTAKLGQDVVWTYTVTNTGPVALKDITLTDTYTLNGVARGTYNHSQFQVVGPPVPAAGLAPGESVSYTITDKVLAGSYSNTVAVTAAGDNDMQPKPVTVTEKATATYTGTTYGSVAFHGNGSTSGSVPDSVEGAPNTTFTVPNQGSLAKPGYVFGGWNTASDGNGTLYQVGSPYTFTNTAVTLYAKWAADGGGIGGKSDKPSDVRVSEDSATGKGVPGSSITVTDKDGHVLCTTTVPAGGVWECVFPAGKKPAVGDEVGVTQTTPGKSESDRVPATVVPGNGGGIGGKSDKPSDVRVSEDSATGKGVPGSSITVTDKDGHVLCTTTVPAGGVWECVFPAGKKPAVGDEVGVTQTTPGKSESDRVPATVVPGNGGGIGGKSDKPSDVRVSEDSATGKGVPGSSITVTDKDGHVLCTTTVPAGGVWECVFPAGKKPAVGDEVGVTQTTPGKSESDRVPATVVAGNGGGIGGKSASPVITVAETTVVSGTGVPGSAITVKDKDGVVLCSTTVGLTYTWSCVPSRPLVVGESVTAYQTEKKKSISDPVSKVVKADGTTNPGKSDPPVVEELDENGASGKGKPGAEVDITDPKTGENLCVEGKVTVKPDGTWKCTFKEKQKPGTSIDVEQKEEGKDPSGKITIVVPENGGTPLGQSESPTMSVPSTTSVSGRGVPGATIVVKTKEGAQLCTSTVKADYTWSCTFSTPQIAGVVIAATQKELGKTESLPVTGVVGGSTSTPQGPLQIVRYSGVDRYGTSLDLNSRRLVKGKPVFVATGGNFPDSLSAGPAVTVQGGSLVLSNKGSMKAGMLTHIGNAEPSMVYIIGETGAISKDVEKQLTDKFGALKVKRVGGVDRYATSAMIASEFFKDVDVSMAFVASGVNFPDALTASAVGGALTAPVLLVAGGKNASVLNPGMSGFLSSKGVRELVIAGGEVAVGLKLEEELGKSFTVSRAGGVDRYATNLLVNALLDGKFPDTQLRGVWLAAGANFPDALSAAVPAGKADQRLVLARKSCVSGTVVDWVVKADSKVDFVGIVGGTAVLASVFENENTLKDARCPN